MKRITFIIISLFALAGCSQECKDTNVITTTKSFAYSKIDGKLIDEGEKTWKWHVRGDSVFLCTKSGDTYRSDTKFINDTIVTNTDLAIIKMK